MENRSERVKPEIKSEYNAIELNETYYTLKCCIALKNRIERLTKVAQENERSSNYYGADCIYAEIVEVEEELNNSKEKLIKLLEV